MNKLFFISIMVCLSSLFVFAQNDSVLFTYGEDKVDLEEFEYIYKKNNARDSLIYQKSSVDEYLDLYINFKLKVKAAEALGYDTIQKFQNELGTYRKQLAQTYLYDKEINEKLIREAYDRMKEEVRVAHILIAVEKGAAPEDTLKAYREAEKLKNKINSGEDFVTIAQKESDDPSVKDNEGDIGYVSVFKTVYPFESATYNTKVGELAGPVRTKFGYHILLVKDRRAAKGKINASHILIKTPTEIANQEVYKERIDSIHKALKQGANFEQLASKLSDDKGSARNGGKLPVFGTGSMVQEFENVAFGLTEDGEISKPFKSAYGWHIVKRNEYFPVESFNKMKSEIKRKLERDARSRISKKRFVEKLKREYKFKDNPAQLKAFIEKTDDKIYSGKWDPQPGTKTSGKLFSLAGKEYTEQDFGFYLKKTLPKTKKKNKSEMLSELYAGYVDQTLIELEDSKLESKYEDFRRLMKEYRDGILLFELTDKKVWSYALKDTVGLQAFYEKNKNNYKWNERADAQIIISKDKEAAFKLYEKLKKGKSLFAEKSKLEKKFGKDVYKIEEGLYEKKSNPYIDRMEWKQGVSEPIENSDGTYSLVVIRSLQKPVPKALNESRGYVVSDYQKVLEKQWIEALKKEYPVKVNDSVLEKMYKN